MTQFLPFHVPEIGDEEIESVVETLRSGWLTTGPKVKQFEQEFAAKIGTRHTVAVNSCTAALHLALEAIGVKEGDEVIVPTMTFASTAGVVNYFKARPVLVDCKLDTMNLDVSQIEKVISPRTKAIIPVHFAGQPCEMTQVFEIARAYNIRVIEDAAHALPAKYRGKMIGTLGDITCFSFYAIKNITTGEGGMATTENPEWAERIRMMALHGITKDAWKRYTSQGSWQYEICAPGFKYNLTDIAAAIGLSQLKKCDAFWELRRRYAAMYDEAFRDLEEITIPSVGSDIQHAWHLYVIRLNVELLRISRNEFIDLLRKSNIGCSVHFIPLHHHPYYRDVLGYRSEDFPVASSLFERILSLPLYPRMTVSDVERVIGVIQSLIKEYKR